MKSVHSLLQFQQLSDETLSWINEKDQTLSTEDCGRDLPSVQTLQRKHMVQQCSTQSNQFSSGIHVHHHLIFCHRRWRESWHQWRRDCTRSQLWRERYRLPTRQRAKLSVIERVKSLLYGRTSRSVFFIALVYYSLHRFTLCRPKQLAEKCNSTMHFFFKPFLLTQKSW